MLSEARQHRVEVHRFQVSIVTRDERRSRAAATG